MPKAGAGLRAQGLGFSFEIRDGDPGPEKSLGF